MKNNIKKGDIVEHFGFDFSPIPFWERLLYCPKWWYQNFSYWLKKQYQRIKYGFPLEESWNFSSHCAEWVLPRLKKMRDDMYSYPCSFSNDEEFFSGQKYFDFFKEIPDGSTEELDYGAIKWQETLDKIIWSFEHIKDEVEPIYPENYDRRQIVVDVSEKGTTFKRVDERKLDFTPVEEHNKKLQEGFELFGKHFQSLWS